MDVNKLILELQKQVELGNDTLPVVFHNGAIEELEEIESVQGPDTEAGDPPMVRLHA